MSVTQSHKLSIGIVGLPNAGKSTLFNSLTQNQVPAENFPFTTIDKNVGVVQIPDERLDAMEKFYDAKKKVPSAITFVDIAGLVKGASKGEGLGNMFLSHIREVDVILYVIRAFNSESIVHVYDRINPVEDFEIVQAELIFKDIESVERKLSDVKRNSRSGVTPELKMQIDVLTRAFEWLNSGKPVVEMEMNEDEYEYMSEMWLLTSKKRMFLLNSREGIESEVIDKWTEDFRKSVGDDADFVTAGDVKVLGEFSVMDDAEKKEMLEMMDTTPIMLEDVIRFAYKRLGLITFYTGSEQEVNSWTIVAGSTAKEAAGVIHTDLSKGFITADIVNVEVMIEEGGSVAAKEKGLVKNQGKDYVVQDGDYVVIYAN